MKKIRVWTVRLFICFVWCLKRLNWWTFLKRYFSFLLGLCSSRQNLRQCTETIHSLTKFIRPAKICHVFLFFVLTTYCYFLLCVLRLHVRPHSRVSGWPLRPRRTRWEAPARWPRRQFRTAPFQASDRAALFISSEFTHVEPKKEQWESLRCVMSFSVSAYNCIPTTKKEVLFRLYWLSEMSTCRLWNIEQKRNWRRPTWNGSNHHIFPNLFIFSNQMFTASCHRFSTRKASSTKSSRI